MEVWVHKKAQAYIDEHLEQGYTLIDTYGPTYRSPSFFRAYLLDSNKTHVIALRSFYFTSTDNEEIGYFIIPISDIINLSNIIRKEAVQK